MAEREDRLRAPAETIAAVCGRAVAWTAAGAGEPLLLLHGLGGTRHTWRHLIDGLARDYLVIAPDLAGHGESAAPNGDYSLGAQACAIRDLLDSLGHERVSIVGHSLGGGVAMQFAYQFPQRTKQIVLIGSGGLGPELTFMLRAATLPGSEAVVAALAHLPEYLIRRLVPLLARLPHMVSRQDALAVSEALFGLRHAGRRNSFVRTARTVISWKGQMIDATRQLSVLRSTPLLAIWGSDDKTIPPHHHPAIADYVPGAHLAEIAGAGHFPHETHTADVLKAISAFLGCDTEEVPQPRPALNASARVAGLAMA
ncbi:alpha/beta fold hydrolase [Catelliglobosispora koreensis]|uniref:alpha/beta fold hydrolase n=1 Tax=Catelliglobosispora koreensis TaxID=129052 RepID=UPI0012F83A76|nr:alpha/beta fold hydrolase [Catelliglobosispora koreensis]